MTNFRFKASPTAGVIKVEIDSGNSDDPRPQLAVVHRNEVSGLPEEWGAGAYVLVDLAPSEDSKRKIYVGEATKAGVSSRISAHISKSKSLENWIFAVVVYGQVGKGVKPKLPFEHVQALEGELIVEFKRHSNIDVVNKNEPGQPELKKDDWNRISSYVKPVLDLLKAMGCDVRKKPSRHWVPTGKAPTRQENPPASPSSNISPPTDPEPKKVKKFGVSLSNLVGSGYLEVDDRLAPSTENGFAKRYSGEGVLIERKGKIFIEIKGEIYSTPSPAARAITGKKAAPGWDFWERSSDGKTLNEIRAKYISEVKGSND